ncbi:hypothetical protein V6R21_20150 [Limibacter armeniacum]|uniref:hypothetical protein n=1 Tax=Limibacter armeniacum TaxID=466084 RepID=UPI002FE6221B
MNTLINEDFPAHLESIQTVLDVVGTENIHQVMAIPDEQGRVPLPCIEFSIQTGNVQRSISGDILQMDHNITIILSSENYVDTLTVYDALVEELDQGEAENAEGGTYCYEFLGQDPDYDLESRAFYRVINFRVTEKY